MRYERGYRYTTAVIAFCCVCDLLF